MRGFGIVVLIAGVLWMVVAAGSDVSVATGMGGRVNNLGLMAQRSNMTMIGGFIAMSGLLMLIFGGRKAASAEPEVVVVQEDARPCPFCAEPIKHAAVLCKHCGSAVEAVEREPVPELHFGWVARVICSDQETRHRVTQQIKDAGLPVVEMHKVGGVAAGAFAQKVEAEKAASILENDLGLATTVMYRDSTSGDYA